MILGNTMNGVSLGLDRLVSGAHQQRPAIEAQLMLGAEASEAMRGVVRDAMRAGLIPTINSMAAAGLEWAPVARLLKAQRRGMRDHSLKIWALLVLDAWRRAA